MRVLITGSRGWRDEPAIREALAMFARNTDRPASQVTVVHGDCPTGADRIADRVARELGMRREPHPADPAGGAARFRDRNQAMVNAGADLCLAFADRRTSGTGMCARMARAARIPTVDYGVDTEAR